MTLEDQYRKIKSTIETTRAGQLRAEGELTVLQEQKDKLERAAEEKFGTFDISELTAMADQIEVSLSSILSGLAKQLEGVRSE